MESHAGKTFMNSCLLNRNLTYKQIKALRALVDRLSLNIGWENGPERGLKTVSFTP